MDWPITGLNEGRAVTVRVAVGVGSLSWSETGKARLRVVLGVPVKVIVRLAVLLKVTVAVAVGLEVRVAEKLGVSVKVPRRSGCAGAGAPRGLKVLRVKAGWSGCQSLSGSNWASE